MWASTSNSSGTRGPSAAARIRAPVVVSTASPAYDMVHVRNGSTHRKCSGPVPSTVGRPSGPSGAQAFPVSRSR